MFAKEAYLELMKTDKYICYYNIAYVVVSDHLDVRYCRYLRYKLLLDCTK